MQNQSNYKEEKVANVKNLATSMDTDTLGDYGLDITTNVTNKTNYFDGGSETQVEYCQKHEESTNFNHVEYNNAIEAYEAYENERNEDDDAEVYERERDKSDNAIKAYEAYENEKDEEDNEQYANIKYSESNESPDVNSNNELKVKDSIDCYDDDDDEIGKHYDHEDFFSQKV